MADTRLAMMSMYSELLAMSLTMDDDVVVTGPPTEKRLLDELAAQRGRLHADRATASIPPPSDAPSRIATEIQYDRTLIKLCHLHAIPCDVARFTRPSCERRRLEEALEAAGVDLSGERPNGPRRAAAAQEPPEGS